MRVLSSKLSCSTLAFASSYHIPTLRETSRWVCYRCSLTKADCSDQQTLQASILHSTARTTLKSLSYSPYITSRISNIRSRAASTSTYDRQAAVREDLPSQKEGRRSHLAKRFSHVMDQVQSNIFIAGQRLNDFTGYSGIEVLKKDIEEQG